MGFQLAYAHRIDIETLALSPFGVLFLPFGVAHDLTYPFVLLDRMCGSSQVAWRIIGWVLALPLSCLIFTAHLYLTCSAKNRRTFLLLLLSLVLLSLAGTIASSKKSFYPHYPRNSQQR